MSAPVRLEHDGDVAVVTFDSPPLNLFDAALSSGLSDVLADLERGAPRAVLFRADGTVVSGGVDVHEFAALEGREDAERMFEGLIELADRVAALPCPTIFAAHALCLTWAFELAVACDLIVAGEGARFGLVESVIGLTPAMGGTQRLAERAGTGRAREFVMTGGLFDATTMERWNVVNRVWPDDEVDGKARALAARLAAGPTRAHAATKAILNAYLEGGVAGANAATPRIAAALWDSEDLPRAVRSFLEEGPGKATFEGR